MKGGSKQDLSIANALTNLWPLTVYHIQLHLTKHYFNTKTIAWKQISIKNKQY